jgi:hypothetical protein
MAVLVTSAPVTLPVGLRITAGTINFNGTTYAAGGLAVTAAQFGGGSNGVPNRLPDFVLFQAGTADDDADTDGATVFGYTASTGKVTKYGDEPLVDAAGLGEGDAAASSATVRFLAFWVAPDPAGSTIA